MKKYIFILIFALTFTSLAQSQNEGKDVKNSHSVTVERDYSPGVTPTQKITTVPAKEEYKPEKPEVNYSTFSTQEQTDISLSAVESDDYLTSKNYDYKKGIFKAGLGFYWQTLGEFYYPLLQGDKYLLDITAIHNSNWSNIVLQDNTTPRAMQHFTTAAINFETQFTNVRLNSKVDFKMNGYDYYGMSTIPDDIMKDTIGSNLRVKADFNLFSTNIKDAFQYDVKANYQYLSRNFGISQHTFMVGTEMEGEVGEGELGAELEFEGVFGFIEEEEIIEKENEFLLYFNPFYKLHGDNWNIKLGGKLFGYFKENTQYPVTGGADITGSFGLVPDLFYLNAAISSDFEDNSYFKVLDQNKYINPYLSVTPTYTPLDVNLGLKINIIEGLLFEVGFDYKLILNDHFFVNNNVYEDVAGVLTYKGYTNTFDVVYEELTNYVNVNAGLYFKLVKGLNLSLTAQYNFWGVTDNAVAWQKPAWQVCFDGTYAFLDKWQVGLEYHFMGGRQALVDNVATPMASIHDLNVSVGYEILDWLSVFAKGNNLINIQADSFYGYRNFGINGMMGVKFSF